MIGNRRIIAVCTSRIQDGASNELVTALHENLPMDKYSFFVYNTCSVIEEADSEKDAQSYIYHYMDYDIIDAVIIMEETIGNQDLVRRLIERGKVEDKPVIVIGESHDDCYNMKFDYEAGFAEVVQHVMVEHQVKKVHLMAGVKGNVFSERRIDTFKTVLEANGVLFDESMVSYGDFWSGPTERAMERILESGDLPEAIVCANDRMALTVCGVLSRNGIRVPEDVVVTGFDGIAEINFSTPRITSSLCIYKDLAHSIEELLDGILFDMNKQKDMSAQKGAEQHSYFIKPRFLKAESCGCHGETTIDVSEYLNGVNDSFYRYRDEEIVLSRLVSRAQKSENLEQLAANLDCPILYDMFCLIEQECVDETINPLEWEQKERSKEREMLVLYDSNAPRPFIPYNFPLNKVHPGFEYSEGGRLLIFTALCYGDVPMGYICFSYGKMDISNYLKVGQTVNAMNNAIGGYRNLRHKQFLMSKIDEMAKVDALTGLRNRHGFEVEYGRMMNQRTDAIPLTVILTDLDGLKQINDVYGHNEGDVAIKTVAQALIKACPPGSIFTRFGGDEMLAVCQGKQNPESIKEAFYNYLDEYDKNSDKNYKVQASLGIYCTGAGDGLEFEQLVEYADKLMYKEKIARKGQMGV